MDDVLGKPLCLPPMLADAFPTHMVEDCRLKVPCHLYPTEYNVEIADNGFSLGFAGATILPKGVKSFIPKAEKIPLSYIAEKW